MEEIQMIPMVAAFDLCLVIAPPIAYTGVDKGQVAEPLSIFCHENIYRVPHHPKIGFSPEIIVMVSWT